MVAPSWGCMGRCGVGLAGCRGWGGCGSAGRDAQSSVTARAQTASLRDSSCGLTNFGIMGTRGLHAFDRESRYMFGFSPPPFWGGAGAGGDGAPGSGGAAAFGPDGASEGSAPAGTTPLAPAPEFSSSL